MLPGRSTPVLRLQGVRPLRLPCDPLRTTCTLDAQHGLAQPAVAITLPVGLGSWFSLKVLHPKGEELTKRGEGPGRDLLHLFERRPEQCDSAHGFECPQQRLRTVLEGRGQVHAQEVLRRALVLIDREHLVDHFVLPEIDLAIRNRREKRFEHRARRGVLTGKECSRALAKIAVYLDGILQSRCGEPPGAKCLTSLTIPREGPGSLHPALPFAARATKESTSVLRGSYSS